MGVDAAIGPIALVTVASPDLAASEEAYVRYFDYRPGQRGRVSRAQACAWGRPDTEGARFVTLHPRGGEDFGFRFVETPAVPGYRAFTSFGWNAAELIVRDVDALVPPLTASPFEILGPPQDLSFSDAIRAMQVRGPAGEILYLTQFKRSLASLPAPSARCDVDQVFIVIVGGPSLGDLLEFYTSRFGVPEPQRMESRVKAMSEAFGLSPEHRYPIAALPLRGHCYIEADQMPPLARPPVAAGKHLPPGIAIVSFRSEECESPACVTGPAGELIEVLPD
jgi:hypothetical protein